MIELLPHLIDGGMGMMALAWALYLVVQGQRERRETLEPMRDMMARVCEALDRIDRHIDDLGRFRGPGE